MLFELRIKDFVLIDELKLGFGPGLNILSGETGAGKSIILGALNLILGGKASPEVLRDGADESILEALFVVEREPWVLALLESVGLEPTDELWIRRIIPRRGRGRVSLNGSPVVLPVLRRLARGLVDFSSQNEHQVLLSPETHLDILDAYAGLELVRQRMSTEAGALRAAMEELEELRQRQQTRDEREEFVRFQLAELERVAPKEGEDDELEAERQLLSHAEKLHSNAMSIDSSLYSTRGSVVETLGEAVHKLKEIEGIDSSLGPQVKALESALFSVEDVARTIGSYARKVRFNPDRLEEIGRRLSDLGHLKRKYRTDLAGVVARHAELVAELETMAGADQRIATLEREVKRRWDSAVDVAAELSQARSEGARRLEKATEVELQTLSMPRARFDIQVSPRHALEKGKVRKVPLGPLGNDIVEFYFSANLGEAPRPLARVASGGELSRVMLALKRSLAGAGEVGTFIFDEIDTGIGGAVAEVVGRKLRDISDQRQLLCITHLAQIAAYADRHFSVRKIVKGNRTLSQVSELSLDARVEEISRMLGGLEITERTREHARELIERCEGYRPSSGEAQCQS